MLKKYITPEFEITLVTCEEILVTSGEVEMENPEMWED